MSFNSINRRGSVGPSIHNSYETGPTTGTYKQENVSTVSGAATGGLSASATTKATQSKALSQRNLQGARPLAKLSAQQLALAQQASQQGVAISRLGLLLLKGGAGPVQRTGGRRQLVAEYLSRRAAEKFCSDDEGESDDGLALLTPIAGNPASAGDLAELMRKAYEKPGEEGRQSLHDLVRHVEGLNQVNVDDALWDELSEAIQESHHDPKARDLMNLLRKRQGLPDRGSDALRKLRATLSDAAADLEGSDGGLIFASINSSSVAQDQPDPSKFTDAYSDFVDPSAYRANAKDDTKSDQVNEDVRFSTHISKLLERYRPEELRNVVPALKAALRDDLDAATQSQQPVWLHKVNSDMGHLHVLSTLLEMVDTMVTHFNRMGSDEARPPLDALSMLKYLNTVLDAGWRSSTQFQTMADNLKLPAGAPTIQMYHGMRTVLAKVPPRVFQDDQVRHSTLTALQGALDLAIAQEEEAFDESEGLVADTYSPAAPRLH